MKKRILFVMNNLTEGGAEKVLLKILNNLNLKNKEITLLLLNNDGSYVKEVEKNKNIKKIFLQKEKEEESQINQKYLKIKKAFNCLFPNTIFKKKFGCEAYDLGIAFLEGPSTLFLSNLKNCKKKIAWVHTDIEKNAGINRIFERISYRNMDKIICVSKKSAEVFEKIYPNLKSRLKVIYNPIDKQKIVEESFEKIEKSLREIDFISVGRLTKVKGYDILLEAHKKLLNEGIKANLIILGEGKERNELEKYISENKLENYVKLLGFVRNPYPYIRKAKIYILSSRCEGYPLVLAEALCLNKPIIATDCDGAVELLENGKYGLLTQIENSSDLKEKMKLLYTNNNEQNKYKNRSEKKIEDFNFEKIIGEIDELFETI